MKRQKITCKFCGHIWLSKTDPKYCPECHNNWRNKPKNARTKK